MNENTKKFISLLTKNNTKTAYSINEFWIELESIETTEYTSLSKESALKDICEKLKEENAIAHMSKQAIDEKIISLKTKTEKYTCKKTIFYKNTNYMFFIDSSSNLSFIYVSGFYSGFAVVDIKENKLSVIFGNRKTLKATYISFLRFIYDSLPEFTSYYHSINDSEFGGFLVSNSRPFHFFYDILPGLETIENLVNKSESLDCTETPILYDPQKSFFEPALIFNKNFNAIKTTNLDELFIKHKTKFYISPAINHQFISNNEKLRDSLDSKAFNSSIETYGDTIKPLKTNKNGIIIWIGITSQKRIWLNQESSIVSLLNALADTIENITVFFDGWTSCLEQSNTDIENTRNDLSIYHSIDEQLDSRINTTSLIGMTSAEKIAYGSIVDVFIANHSAGSLHISRLCKKSGISHINTAMEHEFQWHYDTELLPSKCIKNILDNKKNTIGAIGVDYIVDFKCLSKTFINKLISLGLISSTELVEKFISRSLLNYEKIKSAQKNISAFSSLKITPESKAPDLLRDIAIAFEKSNDIKTAYEIMKVAKQLRPAGGYINKKLIEYKIILTKK
ncbi:hypothetical protein [Oceanisphaera sp. IT1-181]|uniref:hypothetical protein n=1 Tax=Oceanisphaera sp. IT1-181 TaxID=3081199 RepID=UPI0029C9EB8B|nr:hypothetical protein [Oceanisphaera sp. IT1-181]